jgi:hypothetical protein
MVLDKQGDLTMKRKDIEREIRILESTIKILQKSRDEAPEERKWSFEVSIDDAEQRLEVYRQELEACQK